MFIQNLWRIGIGWDEAVPMEAASEWRNYYEELTGINDIEVPRWLGMTCIEQAQLHVFVDASEKAYGAAVYIRLMHTEKPPECHLFAARSKVAPVKTITIPRLELCAAALGVELMARIVRAMRLEGISKFYWSDSEIVLCWLHKFPSSLKTFVSHRVAAIQTASSIADWWHVLSKQNPADLISRGMPVAVLNKGESTKYFRLTKSYKTRKIRQNW